MINKHKVAQEQHLKNVLLEIIWDS